MKLQVSVAFDEHLASLMKDARAIYEKHVKHDLAQLMVQALLTEKKIKFAERSDHLGRVMTATLDVA